MFSVNIISADTAERAKTRYQWELKDWNENFSHRMNFNEYKYRGSLNADVAAGRIGDIQAFDLLEKYTQSNAKVKKPENNQ